MSREFSDLAPTFGDVLLSIGTGVAESQAALDAGLVDAARTLSDTKIQVVTDVIQRLDDDGLPIVAAPSDLVTQEVALINYVSPTMHEWKHVALSMDLSVGAMDQESGFTFNRTQWDGGTAGYGLFWGFVGWFQHDWSERDTSVTSNQRRDADWARGQVRLDALLEPRKTSKISAPAQVTIGPQIYFAQGSVSQQTEGEQITARSVDLLIKVLKTDGSVNPDVGLDFDGDRFRHSFANDGGFIGSTTNPDGEVKVTVTRDIPNARFLRPVRAVVKVRLGALEKSYALTL